MSSAVDVVREGERLRGTFSPLRRRILVELREPASATGLAARLGESRQRVNYHLRELEKAGLVALVEERPRRGRTERIVRTTARAVVVAPSIIGELDPAEQDRFAASTLLAAAARTFHDVAEASERADAAGKRLLTFTIEADIGFSRPTDLEEFATRLASQVAELAAEYDSPDAPRRYQLLIGGHPTARPTPEARKNGALP
jgi:DNA-binding transcriptional ArsR family regulator